MTATTCDMAVGKPYHEVASLNPMTFESLTTGGGYGLWSGHRRLPAGEWRTACYRHAANIESSESTVACRDHHAEKRGRDAPPAGFIFRVGADGIVSDWATGTLPGERIGCTAYAAGIFRRLQFRDGNPPEHDGPTISLVQTSGGQPLSSWGTNVGEIEPGSAEMVSHQLNNRLLSQERCRGRSGAARASGVAASGARRSASRRCRARIRPAAGARSVRCGPGTRPVPRVP